MPRIFAVIGLGTFGSAVALELARRGYEVFACDRDPDKIEELGSELANAVELDATDEKSLRDAGLEVCGRSSSLARLSPPRCILQTAR